MNKISVPAAGPSRVSERGLSVDRLQSGPDYTHTYVRSVSSTCHVLFSGLRSRILRGTKQIQHMFLTW